MRIALSLVFVASSALAQDADWVRAWEAAQKGRPANVPKVGRIATASEPGTPLVVHGRVFNGTKPAPNVVVFAYQTDSSGVYNRKGSPGWRLSGWARSDAQGRFELHTIRPGSYPNSSNPAHIHITIDGPSLPRRWASDIEFADDPLVRGRSRPAARPVTVRNGVQHVDYEIRITENGKF
jgi:protocatechuate 3,4-dioxygenase beta subunit